MDSAKGAAGDGEIGSWEGHAVLITGYYNNGLRIVTWGKEMIMTWEFWEAYCEESYVIFSEDFINKKKTPAGIDIEALLSVIKTL